MSCSIRIRLLDEMKCMEYSWQLHGRVVKAIVGFSTRLIKIFLFK